MVSWQVEHAAHLPDYRRYEELTGTIPDAVRDAPQPTPETARLINLYALLQVVAPLNIGGAVLAAHGGDRDDLTGLATIAATLAGA